MKQTIRLTESELRGMIEESVRQMIYEGEIDEISWKGMGNMFRKGKKDLTKVAQNVGGAVADAGKAVGGAVANAGRTVGGYVADAGKAVGDAAVNTGKAVKGYAQKLGNEYKAGASEEQVNGISAQLDSWFNSGVFGNDQKGYIKGAITRLKDALRLAHNSNYANHSMEMGDEYNARQQRNKRRQDNTKARKNLNQMGGVA